MSNHIRTHTGAAVPSAGALAVTQAAPDGEDTVAYSHRYSWSGGQGNVTFSKSAGDLPDGLVLNSNGTLSGTPTVADTFVFTILGTDSESNTDDLSESVVIAAVPSLGGALLAGASGVAYSDGLDVTGGVAPFVWTKVGALPAGLSMSATTGVISGTPSQSGTFPLDITVTDVNNLSDTVLAEDLVIV